MSEDSQVSKIAELDMVQLRKYAKLLGITAERTWSKEDFIAAIKQNQEKRTVSVVFDSNTGPKPGFSRIIVHRDPSPNHKNTPIHAGYNGQLFQIPRGIEVDVPTPIVESLANAKSVHVMSGDTVGDSATGAGYTSEQIRMSYPFQVLATTPGAAKNGNDGRASNYAERKAFEEMFGKWPTHSELQEAIKAKLVKRFS